MGRGSMAEPKIAIVPGWRNSSRFRLSAPFRIPLSACSWWTPVRNTSGPRPAVSPAARVYHFSRLRSPATIGRTLPLNLGPANGRFRRDSAVRYEIGEGRQSTLLVPFGRSQTSPWGTTELPRGRLIGLSFTRMSSALTPPPGAPPLHRPRAARPWTGSSSGARGNQHSAFSF